MAKERFLLQRDLDWTARCGLCQIPASFAEATTSLGVEANSSEELVRCIP